MALEISRVADELRRASGAGSPCPGGTVIVELTDKCSTLRGPPRAAGCFRMPGYIILDSVLAPPVD
eukprot:COSAG02_NODE_59_length_43585_cov_39.087752_10_plen_66_part_00